MPHGPQSRTAFSKVSRACLSMSRSYYEMYMDHADALMDGFGRKRIHAKDKTYFFAVVLNARIVRGTAAAAAMFTQRYLCQGTHGTDMRWRLCHCYKPIVMSETSLSNGIHHYHQSVSSGGQRFEIVAGCGARATTQVSKGPQQIGLHPVCRATKRAGRHQVYSDVLDFRCLPHNAPPYSGHLMPTIS